MSDEEKKEDEKIENTEELTDKQKAFCIEYPKDFNATQAAIRAGYSDKPDSARNQGSELLAKPCIRKEIDRILKEREDAQRATIRARVLEELGKIGFNDAESDVSKDRDGEIKNVSRKDRLKALELLGRYEALFADKVELSGSVATTPVIDPNSLSPETKADLARAYAKGFEKS